MIHPGIDLGTTYSLIAHVNAHGQPALFPDLHDANLFRTPSIAHVGEGGCLVGTAAEDLLHDAPELAVARFAKAGLGRADWRYVDHLQRTWSAEGISALVLRKLLRDADAHASDDVGKAVVAVPAQFTDEQRRATLRSAALAGLLDVELVEEPVAAALYHGLEQEGADRTVLVYDFGGGTFDVTVLQSGPQGLFVLATDGLADLGGRSLDERIVACATEGLLLRTGDDAVARAATAERLRRLAEDSKLTLSRPGLPQVKKSLLIAGAPFDFVLTRPQFDQLAREAVLRTVACCERCLEAASLGWDDVDAIVLTGGSSLLPQVVQELARTSGKAPAQIIGKQPHQAVAFGAALLAQRRAGAAPDAPPIRQAATADLCLRVWDKAARAPGLETLIRRNTPLPASYARTFYTNREDQTRVVLELVQRRGDTAVETSLGHFSFGPIEQPRRNFPIEIQVALTAAGLVQVTAREPANGRAMAFTVTQDGSVPVDAAMALQRQLVDSVQING